MKLLLSADIVEEIAILDDLSIFSHISIMFPIRYKNIYGSAQIID